MNDVEKAKFTLAVISNENLQISAAVAEPMAECQAWLKEMADEPKLTAVKEGKKE